MYISSYMKKGVNLNVQGHKYYLKQYIRPLKVHGATLWRTYSEGIFGNHGSMTSI